MGKVSHLGGRGSKHCVCTVTCRNSQWFRNQELEHRVSARFYTCIVGSNPTNSTINFPVRASISDAKHSGKSWCPQGSQKVLERPWIEGIFH